MQDPASHQIAETLLHRTGGPYIRVSRYRMGCPLFVRLHPDSYGRGHITEGRKGANTDDRSRIRNMLAARKCPMDRVH
jgi:hypothetical protein